MSEECGLLIDVTGGASTFGQASPKLKEAIKQLAVAASGTSTMYACPPRGSALPHSPLRSPLC